MSRSQLSRPIAADLRARPRAALATALAIVALAMLAVLASPADAAVTQRPQPFAGPGGSQTVFGGVRVISGGNDYNAWEIVEPKDPVPSTAPLVVLEHGYYDYSGYTQLGGLAVHTALKGNIVIYPRWQTGIATPCPGPYNIDPCITSTVTAIHAAIYYLHTHQRLAQPRLDETSYFGFSFGGIITADMLNRYRKLDLPRPRAVFLDDPHDGGLTGDNEPALGPSLGGIPASTKLVCHTGASGVTSQPPYENASCNALFGKLTSIPTRNKNVVLTSNDSHGTPALHALHGVCAGPGGFPVDTYDWGFCWKEFDSLRACAIHDTDCAYALGNTPQHRYIGTWSDGVPVIGLKIQTFAPIRPTPVPARQARPPALPSRPPTARIARLRSHHRPGRIGIHGTASGDNGVQFVQIALVRLHGSHCQQLTPAGLFVRLAKCGRPSTFLWANGDTTWHLTLPARLRRGTYRLYARAIDSMGQTQAGYRRTSAATFTIT